MSTETRKIALGTAALALVAAASLSPVALADISVPLAPGDSASDDSGVGGSAGKARTNRGANARTNTNSSTSAGSNNDAPAAPEADAPEGDAALEDALESLPSADTSAAATGSNPLLQNSLWWFGTPNPTPPPTTLEIAQTEPLADLPGWMRPSYGWFTENDIETCVLGFSNTAQGSVGPYGTATTSFSSRGC